MTNSQVQEHDRRRATVVFVDILGAERLTAEAGIERAYAVVTGCLRVLEGIARRQGGVVDKYLSDCLMAVFGFPLASAEAPAAAVAAAVEMREAAARYARDVESPVPLGKKSKNWTGPPDGYPIPAGTTSKPSRSNSRMARGRCQTWLTR